MFSQKLVGVLGEEETLPWALLCNKLHSTICIVLIEFVSQNSWLQQLSCVQLCNPMDCSPTGFSVHRILPARILECVAIPFSRGSSQPRDGTWVSCIAGRFFTVWAAREAPHKPHFTPTWVGTYSFEDISPLFPHLPGKALKLFFPASPKTLSPRFNLGLGYRGQIRLWFQHCFCPREALSQKRIPRSSSSACL